MNGLTLVLLGLMIAVLAVDAERPFFINALMDVLEGKDGTHNGTEDS